MPHHTSLFHLQQIAQYAVLPVLLPVAGRVQAMDHAEIDIVGFQLLQLPVHLALNRVEIGGPAVFTGFVVGPEMDLIEHLAAYRTKRFSCVGKCLCAGCGKIRIVDPLFIGVGKSGNRFLFRRFKDWAGANADHADFIAGLRVYSVLHCFSSCFRVSPKPLGQAAPQFIGQLGIAGTGRHGRRAAALP